MRHSISPSPDNIASFFQQTHIDRLLRLLLLRWRLLLDFPKHTQFQYEMRHELLPHKYRGICICLCLLCQQQQRWWQYYMVATIGETITQKKKEKKIKTTIMARLCKICVFRSFFKKKKQKKIIYFTFNFFLFHFSAILSLFSLSLRHITHIPFGVLISLIYVSLLYSFVTLSLVSGCHHIDQSSQKGSQAKATDYVLLI